MHMQHISLMHISKIRVVGERGRESKRQTGRQNQIPGSWTRHTLELESHTGCIWSLEYTYSFVGLLIAIRIEGG